MRGQIQWPSENGERVKNISDVVCSISLLPSTADSLPADTQCPRAIPKHGLSCLSCTNRHSDNQRSAQKKNTGIILGYGKQRVPWSGKWTPELARERTRREKMKEWVITALQFLCRHSQYKLCLQGIREALFSRDSGWHFKSLPRVRQPSSYPWCVV